MTRFTLIIFCWTFLFLNSLSQESGFSKIDTSEYIPGDYNFNLLIAANHGYNQEILRLLDIGASINYYSYDGITPIMYASSNGHLTAVKILLLNGANPNFNPLDNEPAIVSSTRNGFLDITEELILAGAIITGKDQYGATALHYASAYNYFNLGDMLLYYGVEPDINDLEQTTPLMAATYGGNIGLASLLLNEGANINNKDNAGVTSLMIAAQAEDTAFVRFLIGNGAKIGAKSLKGNSAVNSALYNGFSSVLDLLWEMDQQSLKEELKSGKPYLLARKSHNKEMRLWLKDHQIQSDFKPTFSSAHIGANMYISPDDFMMGISAGVEELTTGIETGLEYRSRLGLKRVLYEVNENTNYQFWEKRRILALSLSKRIYIPSQNLEIGFSFSLKGVYSFGPAYSGSEKKPDQLWKISPAIAWFYSSRNYLFEVHYDYLSLETPKASPHWIGFRIFYKFQFSKLNLSNKEILWY